MLRLEKATTLADVYQTLKSEPLLSQAELDAYYIKELNDIRGTDRVKLLALRLTRTFGKQPFKCLLMSHPGAGKSTEMTRLSQHAGEHFKTIRFSILSELDPQRFQPFDILILIVIKVVEATREEIGSRIEKSALEAFLTWFGEEKNTFQKATDLSAKVEAGAGAKGDSLWAKLTGLFANLRGEIKYSTHRERKVEEYRLARLSQMITLANQVLSACNAALRTHKNKEWLIVGEDFEKEGVNPRTTESFFIDYRNVITELQCHCLFTIPIALGYSSKAQFLPEKPIQLTDIPVFDKYHHPYTVGRQALVKVLTARMEPDLFEDGQMERLIIASGGNLRDLFSMASNAADDALVEGKERIDKPTVDRAVSQMRVTYERRLGQNPYDQEPVTYDMKKDRLKAIYEAVPKADVPDPILYALLRARAIQEFSNGDQWHGLHPLVVDILIEHAVIQPDPKKGPTGGTY